MKPKLIIKSLSELPSEVLAGAAAMPERALQATTQILAPPVQATRRELRAARRRSMEFIKSVSKRALAQCRNISPWFRGGLNE